MTDDIIPIREEPGAYRDYDTVDDVVDRAKDSNGELVIVFAGRIGATPYMRYTPYENHRGVTVGMWSCISLSFKPMPERTLLAYPHIVEPDELDDYNLRMFTTEWVWNQVRLSRYVKLEPVEETPFGGGLLEWDPGVLVDDG